MVELSLRSNVKVIKTENIRVVYNLVVENARFGVECFKKDSNREDPKNYSRIEGITEDEGEAKAFLNKMARNSVLPIHMNDMVEDFF